MAEVLISLRGRILSQMVKSWVKCIQNMRFLWVFWLILGSLQSFIWADEPATAKKEESKKTQRLLKEVQELNKGLSKTQKKLEELTKNLQNLSPPPAPTKASNFSDSFMEQIESLSQHVKLRMQTFFKGVERLFQGVFFLKLKEGAQTYLMVLGATLALSASLLGLCRPWIEVRLAALLKSPHASLATSFLRITGFLVIPGFLSYNLSHLLLYLKNLLIAQPLPATYWPFIPFYCYSLWAGFWGVRCIFFLLSVFHSNLSWKSDFWLKNVFFLYFLKHILLAILEYTFIDPFSKMALSDFLVALIGMSLWQGLSALQRAFLEAEKPVLMVRWVRLCKWLSLGFFLLWFFFQTSFMTFFIPTAITGFGLIIIGPLQHVFKRLYIGLVWQYRKNFLPFRWAFKYKNWIYTFGKLCVYIIFFSIWGDFFHQFSGENIVVTISRWMFTVLTSWWITKSFNCLLIGTSAFLLIRGMNKFLEYLIEERYSSDSAENNFLFTRLKTMLAMIRTIVTILIGGPATILIISQFIPDMGSIAGWVTGIGVAGLGITFGVQSIIRDFLTGFFIIFENNLMVGDEVEVDQRAGKVEEITMRTLKIRSDNGTLFIIPFGSITIIGNKNRTFSAVLMNISVPYDTDIEKVHQIIEKSFALLKKNTVAARNIVGGMEYRGVNEVTSYSVILQAKIRTKANTQDMVRRQFNKILKQQFDEAGIRVPDAASFASSCAPSLTNTKLS